MKTLSDQKKGSLLAFIAVMFITPDSLFIRLSNVDTWGLVFYRGAIPFFTVLIGMLIIYKADFFKMLLNSGRHGIIYIATFSVTNIAFVVSIQNTNVANTATNNFPTTAAGTKFFFLADLIVTAPIARPRAVTRPSKSP